MLAILVFVDSLSDAALAAGLGSSVVIVFIYPSSHAAQARSLIGGHGLAMLVGSALSLVLFAAPVADFLEDLGLVKDLSLDWGDSYLPLSPGHSTRLHSGTTGAARQQSRLTTPGSKAYNLPWPARPTPGGLPS